MPLPMNKKGHFYKRWFHKIIPKLQEAAVHASASSVTALAMLCDLRNDESKLHLV